MFEPGVKLQMAAGNSKPHSPCSGCSLRLCLSVVTRPQGKRLFFETLIYIVVIHKEVLLDPVHPLCVWWGVWTPLVAAHSVELLKAKLRKSFASTIRANSILSRSRKFYYGWVYCWEFVESHLYVLCRGKWRVFKVQGVLYLPNDLHLPK